MENIEEASNEINEEIKEMSETNEQNNEAPVESRTIFQGINNELSEIPASDKEVEEQHDQEFISSSNIDKMAEQSHQSSNKTLTQPRSRPSVGQYSLRSNTVSSVKHGKEIDSKFSPLLISRRTGKPLCNNFNQTSLIWERKPLAEILHPATTKIPPISEDTERDMDAEEHVTTSAEVIENKVSLHNSQSMGEEESKNDVQLSEEEELKLSNEPREKKQSQDNSAQSIPTPGEDYYGPECVNPEELQIQFDQPPEDKKPLQLQQIMAEEGGIWVNQKTGKEIRSNFNQTSLIWEKKPLAEILQRSRTDNDTSNPDVTQSPED